MTTTVYDPLKFSLQTKVLEQQSYDSAISRAKELLQSKTSVMAHTVSRKICREAFDNFKRNIQATFPYDDYNDLIFLTLKSRENLFFIDLKDRIINILRNPDQI